MGNEGVIPNVAVVDAGPIIHLAQVDALDLLSVFERVLVPRAVYFELSDEGLRSQLEAVGCDLVEVSVDESLASLDSGETAAITLAMESDDAVLLTDDLDVEQGERFELADVYAFEDDLAELYPDNQHIRAKIRQQLQVLRDEGLIEFLGDGVYRLRWIDERE